MSAISGRKKMFCIYRDRLRTVITEESRAYGFTLLIAGSGMLLLRHGFPRSIDVFLFAAGSLAAMMAAVVFSFRRLGQPVFLGFNPPVVPWGLIHAVSVLGGLGAAWLAVSLTPRDYAFPAVAFAGTLIYNLLLGLETSVSTPESVTASAAEGEKC